jgi:AbrB family looped-hinge helix DNA binding protein
MADLQANLTLAADGRMVVPANMRAALGLRGGGKLIARIVDGALVLEPIEVAVRRAQEMVRRFVQPGSGLVDELIAERRAAAERE